MTGRAIFADDRCGLLGIKGLRPPGGEISVIAAIGMKNLTIGSREAGIRNRKSLYPAHRWAQWRTMAMRSL